MNRAQPDPTLSSELQQLMRLGLTAVSNHELPALSTHAASRGMSIGQLAEMLVDLVATPPESEGLRYLLGLVPGTALWTLGRRRAQAALLHGVQADTLRRNYEPMYLRAMVFALTDSPHTITESIAPSQGASLQFRDMHGDINFHQEVRLDQPLPVAVGITTLNDDVLLVCRSKPYGPLLWQFPAGIVKPDEQAPTVAVAETFAETGIKVKVEAGLGQRIHPITGVMIWYFACTYESGVVENRDPEENAQVIWHPVHRLEGLIPLHQIHRPALHHLGLAFEPNSSE